MIVVDASVVVLALLHDGDARAALSSQPCSTTHLADPEVTQAIAGQERRGTITASQGAAAIATWARLGIDRHPTTALLARMWELRHNITAYDASYVALAEALGCVLWTADGRLARAPGPRSPITLVRT